MLDTQHTKTRIEYLRYLKYMGKYTDSLNAYFSKLKTADITAAWLKLLAATLGC